MRAKELREKSDSELVELERELTRALWKTRFDNYTNQLDDTARIRRTRRDLARIKTLMTQRAKSAAQETQG